MIRRILLFIFTFILSLLGYSKSTIIQGSIKGFDGEKIRLAYYEDFISYKKIAIEDSEISNEQFRVEFELEETKQLLLFIQDKQTAIFAEPGQVYNIYLSYSDDNNSKRAFEKYLDLKFSFPKSEELNQRIKKFNTEYQDFFSKNYREFVVKEAENELDEFIKEQESKEIYKETEYLEVYIEYALANLKDIGRQSKEEIYIAHLEGKKVRPTHKEYMNFFVQFYNEDFEQLLITKSGSELMKSLMLEKDLERSIDVLMRIKGFKSQELAELYLINGLFEIYYKKTIDQKSNLTMLEELAESASSKDLRSTASNVHAKLVLGSDNSKAPTFSLKDSDGKLVKLEDLRGKPIYLGFWANWSLLSLRELKLIERLNEDFGDKMHFVSINIDEKEELFRSVKKNNAYKWTFLHAGNDFELREKYEVKTAPIYYLIDEKGMIVKKFATGPQNIKRDLENLVGKGS